MSSNVLQSPTIERLGGDATALSSQSIIFMNGPPLTFKTTISRFLSRRLQVPVCANCQYGTVFTGGRLDNRKRLARYAPMIADGGHVLASGRSVILDGTFCDSVRRAGLWVLARQFGVGAIAIRTACDAPNLIRERARRRAADPTAADHGISCEDHLTILNEALASPLEHDREFWELGVEIVEFHTGSEAYVACAPDARADTRMVASALERCGLLAPFPARARTRLVCRPLAGCTRRRAR